MPSAPVASPIIGSPDDQQRIDHSALRRRLVEGCWANDARTRHQQFFSNAVWSFLPPPDLSHNTHLVYTDALSTLYDVDPVVTIEMDEEGEEGAPEDETPEHEGLEAIVTPELWPLSQQRLRLTVSANECAMRVDVVKGAVKYRVVPPDTVVMAAPPESPDRPHYVEEIRPRLRTHPDGKVEQITTIETWDVRDPAYPVFKIETQDEQGRRTDVTDEFWLDESGMPRTDYPYRRADGTPIFPYVLFHKRVQNALWDPYAGREVVEGTLTASALWTFWLMSVRDGAYPQRVTVDLDVDGSTITTPQGSTVGTAYVQMLPTGVLRFKSRGDKSGTYGTFPPAMDPEVMGRAITEYEASLGKYAGIDQPDVARAAGSSGYALVISQDGKRRAQKRLETPCRMGDALLLATAAALANAYVEGVVGLPEDEDDYHVAYAPVRRSIEEIKAEMEEAKLLLDAGAIDQADFIMRLNPGMSREMAEKKVEAMEAKAARRPPMPPAPPARRPPAPAPEESDEGEDETPDSPEVAPDV